MFNLVANPFWSMQVFMIIEVVLVRVSRQMDRMDEAMRGRGELEIYVDLICLWMNYSISWMFYC